MAYLYRHIRLDKNEPFYIGIGIDSNHRYVRAYKCSQQDRNPIWHRIVSKTKYEVEILLDDISIEFAQKKETEFIGLYGRKDNGTGVLANMTDGGEGTANPSPEIRNKKRERLINNPINIGVRQTEESKRKKSETLKMMYATTDMRYRQSEKRKGVLNANYGNYGKAKHSRKVVKMCPSTGTIIQEYPSVKRAASLNSLRFSNIYGCATGHRGQKTAGGFIWKFKTQ